MNPLQINILIFGIAVVIFKLVMDYALSVFRKKIKVGDVIGVDFGEEVVLNRTVKQIKNNGEIIVLSKDLNYYKSVKLENIYLSCKYTPIDKGFEEDYAS
jgi:hypothetical protein